MLVTNLLYYRGVGNISEGIRTAQRYESFSEESKQDLSKFQDSQIFEKISRISNTLFTIQVLQSIRN
jgi:hypothetical protein